MFVAEFSWREWKPLGFRAVRAGARSMNSPLGDHDEQDAVLRLEALAVALITAYLAGRGSLPDQRRLGDALSPRDRRHGPTPLA